MKGSGVFLEDAFGRLAPEVINGEPSLPAVVTVLKFTTGTGTLTDARKDVITVQGEDAIRGPGGEEVLATAP